MSVGPAAQHPPAAKEPVVLEAGDPSAAVKRKGACNWLLQVAGVKVKIKAKTDVDAGAFTERAGEGAGVS